MHNVHSDSPQLCAAFAVLAMVIHVTNGASEAHSLLSVTSPPSSESLPLIQLTLVKDQHSTPQHNYTRLGHDYLSAIRKVCNNYPTFQPHTCLHILGTHVYISLALAINHSVPDKKQFRHSQQNSQHQVHYLSNRGAGCHCHPSMCLQNSKSSSQKGTNKNNDELLVWLPHHQISFCGKILQAKLCSFQTSQQQSFTLRLLIHSSPSQAGLQPQL